MPKLTQSALLAKYQKAREMWNRALDMHEVLIMAARHGEKDDVIDALHYGADVNFKDRFLSRTTALILAATEGYHEIVEVLLTNNADTTLQNSSKLTALEMARINKRDAVIQTLEAHAKRTTLTTKEEKEDNREDHTPSLRI